MLRNFLTGSGQERSAGFLAQKRRSGHEFMSGVSAFTRGALIFKPETGIDAGTCANTNKGLMNDYFTQLLKTLPILTVRKDSRGSFLEEGPLRFNQWQGKSEFCAEKGVSGLSISGRNGTVTLTAVKGK